MAGSSRNQKSGRGQRRSQAKKRCLKGQTMNSSFRGQNCQTGQCRIADQQKGNGEQNRLLEGENNNNQKRGPREPAPPLMITE